MDSMNWNCVGFVKRKRVFGETSKFRLFKRVNNGTFCCFFHTTNMETKLQIVIKKVLHMDRQWRL